MMFFIWFVVFWLVLPMPMDRVYSYAEALDCGLRYLVDPPSDSRFMGGDDAVEGAWPWQVSLFFLTNHLLGGAILSSEWVLSDANNNVMIPENLLTVVAGITVLSQPGVHQQRRSVAEIKIHPGHNRTASDNDVALLRLATPLVFNDYVQPICVPYSESEEDTLNFRHCFMTGWNRVSSGSDPMPPADKLQVGRNMQLIDSPTCDQSFGGNGVVTENMICAYRAASGNDTNQSDQGGPLQCYSDVSKRFYLLGISSQGDWVGLPASPGVYARVSRFSAWIAETTNLTLSPFRFPSPSPSPSPTPSRGSKSCTSLGLVLLCGALLLLVV